MCGFIAQLVEHRTGIAEVTGSNPVEALIFFRLLLSNCLNWKIYCDDHSSLSQAFSAHYIAARLGDLSYTLNTTTGLYIGIRFKTPTGERTTFMLDASVVMFAQVFSAHYVAVLLGDLSCTINTTKKG